MATASIESIFPAFVKTPTEQMTGKAPKTISKKVLTRRCDGCGQSFNQPLDPWGYLPCCPACVSGTRVCDDKDEDRYDGIDALMDGHY